MKAARQRGNLLVVRLKGNKVTTLTVAIDQNGHAAPLGPRSWLVIFRGKLLNTWLTW